MTNADRIRAMTDEELATWIIRITELDGGNAYCENLPECDADLAADREIPQARCAVCMTNWLKSAANLPKEG